MKILGFFILLSHMSFAQWLPKSSFPAAGFDDGIAFSFDTTVYVGTGLTDNYSCQGGFWKYHVEDDTWVFANEFPGEKRQYASAVVVNGVGYLIGGLNCNGESLSDVWAFYPVTNQWVQKQPLPNGLYRAFSIDIKGDILVFGGRSNNEAKSEILKYSIDLDAWQLFETLPFEGRYDMVGFVENGKIYCGLGTTQAYENNYDWWSYDYVIKSWTRLSPYPGLNSLYMLALSNGRTNFIGLGSNVKNEFSNEAYTYISSSNSWIEFPKNGLPTVRGVAGFTVGNSFFFCGGLDGGLKRTSSVWVYQQELIDNKPGALYPNPANGKICFSSVLDNQSIECFNAVGQRQNITTQINGNCIDVSLFSPGLYTVTIGGRYYNWIKL